MSHIGQYSTQIFGSGHVTGKEAIWRTIRTSDIINLIIVRPIGAGVDATMFQRSAEILKELCQPTGECNFCSRKYVFTGTKSVATSEAI